MMCGAQIMIHINISSLSRNIKALLYARTSHSDVSNIYFPVRYRFPPYFRPRCFALTGHLRGPRGKLNEIGVSSIWPRIISVM